MHIGEESLYISWSGFLTLFEHVKHGLLKTLSVLGHKHSAILEHKSIQTFLSLFCSTTEFHFYATNCISHEPIYIRSTNYYNLKICLSGMICSTLCFHCSTTNQYIQRLVFFWHIGSVIWHEDNNEVKNDLKGVFLFMQNN